MKNTALSVSNKKLLGEVTRRIVASVNPSRVLLFGSAARGRMDQHSDFDMLVVMRAPAHRRQTAQKIYRNLRGAGIAVDIVVATEQDLKKYGGRAGTILKSALRERFKSQVASIFSMRRVLAIYTILSLDNVVCS